MHYSTILLLLLIGLSAGVLSGFVGIGGGIVIVPCLVFILGMTQHDAQGTSLALLMTPVGILAVFNYYKNGNINVSYAALMALGFVAGAFFGSKLAIKVSPEIVRRVFGFFMLLVALKLILNK